MGLNASYRTLSPVLNECEVSFKVDTVEPTPTCVEPKLTGLTNNFAFQSLYFNTTFVEPFAITSKVISSPISRPWFSIVLTCALVLDTDPIISLLIAVNECVVPCCVEIPVK